MPEDSRAATIEQELRREWPSAFVVWTDGHGHPMRANDPRSRQLARDVDLTARLLTTVGERQGMRAAETILVTYDRGFLAIGHVGAGRVAIFTDKSISAGLLSRYVQRLVVAGA